MHRGRNFATARKKKTVSETGSPGGLIFWANPPPRTVPDLRFSDMVARSYVCQVSPLLFCIIMSLLSLLLLLASTIVKTIPDQGYGFHCFCLFV
jgi:hypothetical protein